MTLAALASLLRHTPGLCRRRWEEGSCTSAVVILLAVAKQIAKDRMSFRVFGMVAGEYPRPSGCCACLSIQPNTLSHN